jgi:hypothetical protein
MSDLGFDPPAIRLMAVAVAFMLLMIIKSMIRRP